MAAQLATSEPAAPASQLRRYTREEVARHSTPGDAWVIIDKRVYDVTEFAEMHPGGERLMLEHAGQDVTKLFNGLHRQEALAKYQKQLLIGVVDDAEGPAPRPPMTSRVPYAENAWQRDGWKSPYYTASHHRFRAAVRSFVRKELWKDAEAGESSGTPPSAETWLKMGKFGLLAARMGPGKHLQLLGTPLPGGVPPAEFDYFHEMIAHEEMALLGCPSYQDGLGGGMVIGLPPVLVFGSPELAMRVGGEVLRGERQIALAISEPFAGSDVANIRTTATCSADGSHYIVNGVKKWITNGHFSHYFATAVRTGGEGIGGISLLLIERSEGLETEHIKVTYGNCAGTAYITFDNVRVPAENLLGKENRGFRCIMANFNHERWLIICGVLRGARAIVEECYKWAVQREVFGERLIDKPVIRAKLAAMSAEMDGAHAWLESLTFQMTNMSYAEQGEKLAGPLALLKLLATKAATHIADESCQIFGGRALTSSGMGKLVERYWRAVKFGAILGGSEEIMADLGVRQALRTWPAEAKL